MLRAIGCATAPLMNEALAGLRPSGECHYRETPWDDEARYLPSGLPANMAAVLRDQWKRKHYRGRTVR